MPAYQKPLTLKESMQAAPQLMTEGQRIPERFALALQAVIARVYWREGVDLLRLMRFDRHEEVRESAERSLLRLPRRLIKASGDAGGGTRTLRSPRSDGFR
jgi:hypothetical protein